MRRPHGAGILVAGALLMSLACGGNSPSNSTSPVGPSGQSVPDSVNATFSTQAASRVSVCHIDSDTSPISWLVLSVATAGVPQHLAHGDFVIDANHPCPPRPHLTLSGNPVFHVICDPPDSCPTTGGGGESETLHQFTLTNDGNAPTGTIQNTISGLTADFNNFFDFGGVLSFSHPALTPGASSSFGVRFHTDLICGVSAMAQLTACAGAVSA